MNWLPYVSWIVSPVLLVVLLGFMVKRNLRGVFPRFFSYIIFQILKTGVLYITYRFFPDGYFDVYWTGNAASVLLGVAVMDEILHNLFQQYGGIQTIGITIFRWACGLLLLLSIVGAVSGSDSGADRVVDAVLSFERSVRLMQCGLFLLLMLLCRILKHCWRQPVFGIALGFGLFASIELILVSFVMWQGDRYMEAVSLSKSLGYNFVTLLWIGYLQQRTEEVPAVEPAPRVNALNMALATSAGTENEASFLSMVEQAVDRVLSRHSWPDTPVDSSQVVSRKPLPEENN